jgi:hypothetical protein
LIQAFEDWKPPDQGDELLIEDQVPTFSAMGRRARHFAAGPDE